MRQFTKAEGEAGKMVDEIYNLKAKVERLNRDDQQNFNAIPQDLRASGTNDHYRVGRSIEKMCAEIERLMAAQQLIQMEKLVLQEENARLKAPVSIEELRDYFGGVYLAHPENVNDLIADRVCARLKPKPKTPQERVAVKRLGASEAVYVYLDGVQQSVQFDDEKHANRYAGGLIAELEKEGKNGPTD